jgi:hypothetical protein
MSEYTRAVSGSLEQGQADFTPTYTSLQAEVTSLGAVIGTAHANYQSAEAANTALWS